MAMVSTVLLGPLGLGDQVWAEFIWFVIAASLLGAFDISLPRRDSVGVSGALDVVALVVVQSLGFALLISLFGAVVSYVVRFKVSRPSQLVTPAIARMAGLGIASLSGPLLSGISAPLAHNWSSVFAIVVYLAAELTVSQALTASGGGRSVLRAIRGSAAFQTPLLAAQASAAWLAVIVYPTLGTWSLLLAVALLLLIRQSYALLLDTRETFRTTVEVLVEAAEGPSSSKHGHAERTARIARMIAARLGLPPGEVERVAYAALLHDIGEIGLRGGDERHARSSTRVIEGVAFFSDVTEVLRVCDGRLESLTSATDSALLEAFIVALASDIDEQETHGLDPERTSHAREIAAVVPPASKARAVGAALRLGYGIPAL